MSKRTKVSESLRQVVASSYVLLGETHLCHWNVRGPGFFALHTAFEEQYTELFTAIDEIAERIRALGDYAPGGIAQFNEMVNIAKLPEDASAEKMVEHLSSINCNVVEDLKIARDLAAEAEDSQTEDLLIARIQVHEKHIWMLKSYLE